MALEALLKISSSPGYIIDSNLWFWMTNQDYINLIGEFPKDQFKAHYYF